ncbi:hypothetical protein SAMN05660420_03233 [Desulfuromusa kysingii]|uniref:Uncharacterized protein n=1 Tax=Desulfuromusa kysingii TaxID=37625 RepID=A0A1H4E537_9BACT|nr:hypothetical protein [Desulfuromusa kysingii]SEA80155.1 hypothetical protein SAMN05660420_03233 [Desulfuromusa kysingii]
MKSIVILLFLLFPVVAAAQDQPDMGKMMEALQEMQQCMATVDQEELRIFEQEAEEMEAMLQSLCQQGKRDQAQKEAIKFGKKTMKNPTLIKMQKCGEMAQGFVPEGAIEGMNDSFDPSKNHVCDDFD